MRVRFGHVANPFSAPVRLALERGYFDDAGVALELTTFANGSLASAALAAGEVELAVGGHIQTLVATLGGAAQLFIGPLGFERSPDHLPIALVARAGVSSGRELEGAVVGMSARGAISELQLRIFMGAEGAEFESLELRAMPFDELAGALGAGEVAAASCPDPLAARLVREGLGRVIDRGSLSRALAGGERAMITGIAASRPWLQANEDAARAVLGAVGRAIGEAAAEAPAEVPAGEHAPLFDSRLQAADLQLVFDLAFEHGLVEHAATASELIAVLD
jgi:NitT/TauT family transport system substrate-binding protein